MPDRYPTLEPFIANTDRAWFDFLASRATDGRVDEVNFWLPKATTPMKQMLPGETIFFRLKKPDYAIAGYGFFAHFDVVDLHTAWSAFGWKNGDPDKRRFFERIGNYRRLDLLNPASPVASMGCPGGVGNEHRPGEDGARSTGGHSAGSWRPRGCASRPR